MELLILSRLIFFVLCLAIGLWFVMRVSRIVRQRAGQLSQIDHPSRQLQRRAGSGWPLIRPDPALFVSPIDKRIPAMAIKNNQLYLLRWPGFFVLILLIFLGSLPLPEVQAQLESQPAIESDESGLLITWTPPAPVISGLMVDGEAYSQIQILDLALSGQPGYPQLPYFSGMIGLPQFGDVRLEIEALETDIVPLPNLPIPAPIPQPVHVSPTDLDPQTSVSGGPTVRSADPALYGTDAFYPANIAELDEPQQVRNHRMVRLKLNPLRVNPVRRQMEIVRLLRLRIDFMQPALPESQISSQQLPPSDSVTGALEAILLNPEARLWVADPVSPDSEFGSQTVNSQAAGDLTKIFVNEAGLHTLTHTALQNAGLPVDSLDPRTLKLSYGYSRQEVAIVVEGEGDGRFDSGDRLLFFADLKPSRYVDHDVYFLSYGGANGLRMGSRSGSPAGLTDGVARRTSTAETNQFYDPLYQARDGDRWYWDKLFQPDQLSKGYGIQLQSPLTTAPAAGMTVWLQGYTSHPTQNPDHRVQFHINNTFIGTAEWDGKTAYTATLTVPSSSLLSGSNQVRLTLPGISGVFAEGVWLDAIRITYSTNQAGTGQTRFQGEAGQRKYTLNGVGAAPLVFDITNSDTPLQIFGYSLNGSTLIIGDAQTTAATYLIVPASQVKQPFLIQQANILSEPAGGADYIIITPSSLAGAVAPLAAHRTDQGLRVTTVDVQAVYDTYGGGRIDAEAIKTFLADAYQNWTSPAPLYVLLVGDGSYDFKNYSGYNPQTLIPPYLAQVDPWWGETAADNRLVTLAGNDNLPEMLIGRLSVSSAAETSGVVNKIIQYETNPPNGPWKTSQIFLTDNPDNAGDFYASSDQTYNKLTASYTGSRYYYSNNGSSQPYIYDKVNILKANFLSSFNNGASFVTFYGHSSWEQWAVENLLALDDFGQLNNQSRLPIVSQMTCFTGFFHHPKAATFDESLLRRANGGAVAAWGGAGLGVGTGHDKLQEGFYEAIMFEGQPVLGAAIMAGKLNLFATGFHLDLVDTFTLFGDPALNLSRIFQPDLRITQEVVGSGHQPGGPVTIILTIQNTGAGKATGVVVTDNLPAAILSPSWSTLSPGVNATGTYVWTLPDLYPNETIRIEISGTIDPSLPPNFSILNIASVSSGVSELSHSNNNSSTIVGGQRIYLPVLTR